jgi:hypothetical protein
MEVQSDYETDLVLAVFRTSGEAEIAMGRLAQDHVQTDDIRMTTLPPGRYDLADGMLGEEMSGVMRGAEIGVPAGAVVGLGAAASLLSGPSAEVLAGLAIGGAFAGAVLGALEGAVLRARFDDGAAAVHHVAIDQPEALLILHTASANDGPNRARRILRSAGAVAFLDSTVLQLKDQFAAH